MSNQATAMYALSLDQIQAAIIAGGNKRTMLIQGHMGTGKSSLLRTLATAMPTHIPCYLDRKSTRLNSSH